VLSFAWKQAFILHCREGGWRGVFEVRHDLELATDALYRFCYALTIGTTPV
jgi:hypothetical protein